MRSRCSKFGLLLVCLIFVLSPETSLSDVYSSVFPFNIKRQSLATALLDFSYQSDVQVVMPGALAEGLIAAEVVGEFTPEQALDTLLKHTGLEYVFSSAETVTIQRKQRDQTLSKRRRRRLEQLGLEQMFVRGERREQKQDVDTTVSQIALTGEDLESRGVKNADDLQQFVPGLTVESPQTANTEFSIRGAGISDDDLSTAPGVAVFIDDIYIPRQSAANMALYELDRVEILRGPQATQYAHNATGGSIIYVTRKPTSEFEARYLVEAGNYNHFNNLLTVNGELKDDIYGQVALASFKRDPIMQNIERLEDGNNVDSNSLRLAFRIVQSKYYEWLLSFDGEKRRQDGVLYSIGPEGPYRFAEGLPEVAVSDPVRSARVDTHGGEDLETMGMMMRLNVDTEHHRASYIFGRRSHEFAGLYDLDQTPELLVNRELVENSDTLSFEARWSSPKASAERPQGSLGWNLGVLLLEEKAEARKNYLAPGLNAGENEWNQILNEQSYSIYGDVEYQISRKFRFESGLRYISDFRAFDLDADTSYEQLDNVYLQEDFQFQKRHTWRRVTPRVALHYKFAPESSVYVSASSGYKPGGYHGTPLNLARARVAYRPESVNSYEVGLHSNWFANRIKLNSAFYLADYRDMQVSDFDEVGNSFLQNADQVRSKGLEVELQARPIISLKVSMGMSIIDAKFLQFEYESEDRLINKSGDRVPRIPYGTLNLSAVYLFPDTTLGSWSVRADAAYSEEVDDINNDPAWLSYRHYNLWLDYLPHNGKWELSLWVRNLRDQAYFQAASPGVTNGNRAFARKLAPPRISGLSMKYFW